MYDEDELQFFKLDKVASILDVSIRTVRQLIEDGRLKAKDISSGAERKNLRVSNEWIRDFMKPDQYKVEKRRSSIRITEDYY